MKARIKFDPLLKHLNIDRFFQLRKGTKRELATTNLVAALVGILTGYGALGFAALIGFFQNLFFHHQIDFQLISPLEHIRGPWVIVLPAVGILIAAMLARYLAPEAEGHGVPEVIESVMRNGGRMRKRLVAVKALASSITIGAGGSVGREGPVVQIGAAIGSVLGQTLRLRSSFIKTLVGCGATGAIAASFNTPIAAVIFAVELILFEFKFRSFVPLVISSVFATMITRIYLGDHVAFEVPHYAISNPIELLFYMGLGLASGLGGVFFIKTLYGIEDTYKEWEVPFWAKAIIGGLIVGAVCYHFPDLFGSGYDAITGILNQELPIKTILALLVLKVFMTSITLASGGSGGVFAPSLFLGAMLGGAYGYCVNYFFPELTTGYGAYALVGMAAFFTATSRATFTSIVILFEMTADYSIILPLMLCCVVSSEAAWMLSKHSIYSLKLARRGLNMVTDLSVSVIDKTLVKEIMTPEPLSASKYMNLEEAHERFSAYHHKLFPIVDENGRLEGVIGRYELERVYQLHLKEASTLCLEDFMQPTSNTAYPNETVHEALNRISAGKSSRIMVITPNERKLIGIISPSDFVKMMTKAEENS